MLTCYHDNVKRAKVYTIYKYGLSNENETNGTVPWDVDGEQWRKDGGDE